MIYIFLATIFYSLEIIVGTYASRIANTYLVVTVINIVSAILPTIIALPYLSKANYHDQKLGLLASIVAGILIALFGIALTKSYAVNKVAVVVPIVFGGSIFISAILSFVIFKEKISTFQGIGLFFLAIGLIIVTYARFTGR